MKGKRITITLDEYEREAIHSALKKYPQLKTVEGAIHNAIINAIPIWEGRRTGQVTYPNCKGGRK